MSRYLGELTRISKHYGRSGATRSTKITANLPDSLCYRQFKNLSSSGLILLLIIKQFEFNGSADQEAAVRPAKCYTFLRGFLQTLRSPQIYEILNFSSFCPPVNSVSAARRGLRQRRGSDRPSVSAVISFSATSVLFKCPNTQQSCMSATRIEMIQKYSLLADRAFRVNLNECNARTLRIYWQNTGCTLLFSTIYKLLYFW